MNHYIFGGLLTLGVLVLVFVGAPFLAADSPIAAITQNVAAFAGVAVYPDRLGWMDDEPLTASDRARIATITGSGASDNLQVIRGIQVGASSSITRRDFELLRQDRRRAKAAYPTVSDDDLYGGTWLQTDLSARIPDKFCSSGNSNGTEVGGKRYLDGGCYVGTVRSQYTERADAPTTRRVLAELKDTDRQKELQRWKKWGYSSSWGSSGGESLTIKCNPDPLPSDAEDGAVAGKCVVISDAKEQYVFPFDPNEWASPPWDIDGIRKLPSFAQAVKTDYHPAPEKPWVMRDGLLAKGETCPEGRLCFSHWNGDGYDNKDIGPANPVCWSLSGFGTNYDPCNPKDERRATPGASWSLAVSWYGSVDQISPGWTEQECKAMMPKYLTGFSFGMQGQDTESMNRGNLRQARCFQSDAIQAQGIALAARALPVPPPKQADHERCAQGGVLMPGQSCTF